MTLLIKILIIKKVRRNFFLTAQVPVFNIFFVLVTPQQSQPTKKEADRSPQMSTLRHTTSLCWRLMTSCHHPSLRWYWQPQYPSQFLKCEQLPSSRWRTQPQSVDTVNYAQVNPLPSPATSSSSSGELHLYIDSGTSSPSVPALPHSSSQEPQRITEVPQPPPLSTAHTAVLTQQPLQPTDVPYWADEVATAEQSGHSAPEMVVFNWAYSGTIRGARPRSKPLVYQPPVMPTPFTQRPPVPSPRYGPVIQPLRPQQSFPQPPFYDRPTSTDNYFCNDPSLRRRPRATAHEIYPVRSSPIQASQSPARHTTSSPRGPQPSSSRGWPNPFRQLAAFHTGQQELIFDSPNSPILLALIPFRVYMCQRRED